MPSELSCEYVKDNGEPCGAPASLVDPETRRCWTHSEEGREKAREAASKGGKATARRLKGKALDEDELPPLVDADAAETWCDVVGRAVVTGRIGHNQGKAALRAVREWRESHEAGKVSEKLDSLTDALAEWKRTGDPEPVLELVKGGR